jgi:hypothetical protein
MTFDRMALIAAVMLAVGFGFVEHRTAASAQGASNPIKLLSASTGVPTQNGTFLVGAFVVKDSGDVRFCQATMDPGKTPKPSLTCVPEK